MLLALSTPAWEDASESITSAPVPTGRPLGGGLQGSVIRPGFLGMSLEFDAVTAFTGRDATAVNPLLVQLIRDLSPGQPPVLRIGGNSADRAWWPVRGVTQPASVSYRLTRAWLRRTGALAHALDARMILGVNLAMNRPRLAAAEARALMAAVGRPFLSAIEIGNEADIYRRFPRYRDARGRLRSVRTGTYSLRAFTREFRKVRETLPGVPLAGPTFGNIAWMAGLDRFLTVEPGLRLVTLHRYPLSCFAPPSSPKYPTIANLLSDTASHGLARGLAPYAVIAHVHHMQFRLDELNSVSCGGKRGVSDTFASALWMLDTLFETLQAGVDGVNVHTLPHAAYAPFTFRHTRRSWSAAVRPSYYGLRMFAEATPPGSRLLPVTHTTDPRLKVWATIAPDRKIRYVLINKSTSPRLVMLRPPGYAGTATIERLAASRLAATGRVTLGGQRFAAPSRTAALIGRPTTATIHRTFGVHMITLPPASATLLTACTTGCVAPTQNPR